MILINNSKLTIDSLSSAYKLMHSKKNRNLFKIYLTNDGFKALSYEAFKNFPGEKPLPLSQGFIDAFAVLHQNEREAVSLISKVAKVSGLTVPKGVIPEKILTKDRLINKLSENENTLRSQIAPRIKREEELSKELRQIQLDLEDTEEGSSEAYKLTQKAYFLFREAYNIQEQLTGLIFPESNQAKIENASYKLTEKEKAINKKLSEYIQFNNDFLDEIEDLFSVLENYKEFQEYLEIQSRKNEFSNYLDQITNQIELIKNSPFKGISTVDSLLKKLEEIYEICEKYMQEIADNKFPYDSPFFQKIKPKLEIIQNTDEGLRQLFSPIHFHRNCSQVRAEALLSEKPEGFYVFRPSDDGVYFAISYVKNKNVLHQKIYINVDGSCSMHENQPGIPLEDFLEKNLTIIRPRPVENIPLDNALAQFEWNSSHASEKEMLEDAKPEQFFITKKSNGVYRLTVIGKTNEVSHYKVNVRNNKITCFINGQKKRVASLHDLITKELGLPYCILIKQPFREMSVMEKLLYQRLLHQIYRQGAEWAKAFRQEFPSLPQSVWLNKGGQVYQPYYGKGFEIIDMSIFDLPFYIGIESPAMVPALFREPSGSIELNRQNLAQIKQTVDCTHLLIPSFVTYQRLDGSTANSQMMPALFGGDLFDAKLSKIGQLRAMRDVCKGLCALHHQGWIHRNVKLESILLRHRDKNQPGAMLADFEYVIKIAPNSTDKIKIEGTYKYIDPAVFQDLSRGVEGGKALDQFSFGMTLFILLTDTEFREEDNIDTLKKWVELQDLEQISEYRILDLRLQTIIRECCVGTLRDRPYKLPEFLATLDEMIAELD